MWVFRGVRLDGTRHKDGPDAKPDKKNSVKIFLLVPSKCGGAEPGSLDERTRNLIRKGPVVNCRN